MSRKMINKSKIYSRTAFYFTKFLVTAKIRIFKDAFPYANKNVPIEQNNQENSEEETYFFPSI